VFANPRTGELHGIMPQGFAQLFLEVVCLVQS